MKIVWTAVLVGMLLTSWAQSWRLRVQLDEALSLASDAVDTAERWADRCEGTQ